MFDHVGVNVRDFERSRAFYRQALEPLGLQETMAFEEWKAAAFGPEGKYEFWVAQREPYGTGTHVAFSCDDRETVDAFHAAALAAGGTDNGPRRHPRALPPDLLRRVRPRPGRQQHRGGLPQGLRAGLQGLVWIVAR